MTDISGTMLAERLLEMERERLVTKKIYGAVPPKVEYRLTASARELEAMLKELGKWHVRWKSSQIVTTTQYRVSVPGPPVQPV